MLLTTLFALCSTATAVLSDSTTLNSTRLAPSSGSSSYNPLNVGPGGFAEITPYVNSALTYKPKGAGPISNHNGYTLYGDSNVYAVYYGQSSYFNGEPAQSGSGTVYNQPFADALDEFLMNFGATSQWKTTQAYGAGGLKFNMRTGLRIDETSSHYLGEGSFYGIEDTFTNWFASLISSKKLPNDPVSGIYVIIISEGENLRSSSSNSKSWVISSKGETQLNGQFADCSVHSYSEINSNFYFWAMISIPQMGTQSQNCFSRQMNAMGLTSDSGIASVIKRLATMNAIAHELMELVTDPFTGTAWYAGSATQNPTEMADLCITAFLNVNPTKYTDPYANSRRWNGNTVINGHAYLLQAAWDPVKQQCQA